MKALTSAENLYAWSLYFFKIDRRAKSTNPYNVYKIRFRKTDALRAYAERLMGVVKKNQIAGLERVQEYTGDNSKVSCDKISLENSLIKEKWEQLFEGIGCASDQKISGKYQGYILTGIPNDSEYSAVTLIKMANPVIDMKKQKDIMFHFTDNDEVDILSDNICRLYMNVDMIVIDNWLYAFNLKVENLFDIEKTMKKIKQQAIKELVDTNAFADREEFEKYAKAYKSPRTFLTFNKERLEKLKSKKRRKDVAKLLELKTDSNGQICFENQEDVSLLIRYVCFKVFRDDETKNLLEASHVEKLVR